MQQMRAAGGVGGGPGRIFFIFFGGGGGTRGFPAGEVDARRSPAGSGGCGSVLGRGGRRVTVCTASAGGRTGVGGGGALFPALTGGGRNLGGVRVCARVQCWFRDEF